MQLCPAFNILLCVAIFAASKISASSKIINGSLPPSSITVFLICFPASDATEDPAYSLPVKVMP